MQLLIIAVISLTLTGGTLLYAMDNVEEQVNVTSEPEVVSIDLQDSIELDQETKENNQQDSTVVIENSDNAIVQSEANKEKKVQVEEPVAVSDAIEVSQEETTSNEEVKKALLQVLGDSVTNVSISGHSDTDLVPRIGITLQKDTNMDDEELIHSKATDIANTLSQFSDYNFHSVWITVPNGKIKNLPEANTNTTRVFEHAEYSDYISGSISEEQFLSGLDTAV